MDKNSDSKSKSKVSNDKLRKIKAGTNNTIRELNNEDDSFQNNRFYKSVLKFFISFNFLLIIFFTFSNRNSFILFAFLSP